MPRKFTASTKNAAIGQKLKEKIMRIKEIYERMEMETTISDVPEKKRSPTFIVMAIMSGSIPKAIITPPGKPPGI